MMLGLGSVSVSPTPSLTKTTVGVLPRLHVVGGGHLAFTSCPLRPGLMSSKMKNCIISACIASYRARIFPLCVQQPPTFQYFLYSISATDFDRILKFHLWWWRGERVHFQLYCAEYCTLYSTEVRFLNCYEELCPRQGRLNSWIVNST